MLHGTWLLDLKQFALWGERCDTPQTPGLHPFVLEAGPLLQVLDRLAPASEPTGQPLTVLLPTRTDHPQPSPEARAAGMTEPAHVAGDLALRAWQVYALLLRPVDALAALLAESQSPTWGADLRFWSGAARWVARCLVEQRYVPVLQGQGAALFALWQPVPDARYEWLARNMPTLCRAMTDTPAAMPDAEALLAGFMQTCLDAHVRRFAQESPAEPARFKLPQPILDALTGPDSLVRLTAQGAERAAEAWRRWLAGPQAEVGKDGRDEA